MFKKKTHQWSDCLVSLSSLLCPGLSSDCRGVCLVRMETLASPELPLQLGPAEPPTSACLLNPAESSWPTPASHQNKNLGRNSEAQHGNALVICGLAGSMPCNVVIKVPHENLLWIDECHMGIQWDPSLKLQAILAPLPWWWLRRLSRLGPRNSWHVPDLSNFEQ